MTAQAVPNAYVIDKRERPPCVSACPMGQNAQAYIALLAQGKSAEAAEIIRKDNPLPLICGYVCHRPCESECQQGKYGDPVSIRALKRFAIENAAAAQSQPAARREEKVAIIGSGPAGLAAADYLARRGYPVTIFEAMAAPGGMMRAGIPDFRLPRNVLDSQIDDIVKLGVDLKLNSPVGPDVTIDGLFTSGYKAVFAAVGAQKSSALGVKGEEFAGVRPGIEFIRQVNLGEQVKIGDRVAVIGAGNAAMDIARTARRLGAKDVTIVYRRTKREMAADPVEVEDAAGEGVKFVFLTNPKRFVGTNGKLTGIECLKMKLSDERDASGRRRPEPIARLRAYHSVRRSDPGHRTGARYGMVAGANVELNKWGLIQVDPVTLETGAPGVFAGGDVVAGAGTLSEAVAAGKRAAESIERFLNKEDLAEGRTADPRVWTEEQHSKPIGQNPTPDERLAALNASSSQAIQVGNPHRGLEKAQLREKRQRSKRIATDREMGYTAEQAIAEARRCLACGICCECGECVKACLAKAIDHDMRDVSREIEVGAVILAPGYEEFDARERGEFGFGRCDNVVTNVQFERMLWPAGLTAGISLGPRMAASPERSLSSSASAPAIPSTTGPIVRPCAAWLRSRKLSSPKATLRGWRLQFFIPISARSERISTATTSAPRPMACAS